MKLEQILVKNLISFIVQAQNNGKTNATLSCPERLIDAVIEAINEIPQATACRNNLPNQMGDSIVVKIVPHEKIEISVDGEQTWTSID